MDFSRYDEEELTGLLFSEEDRLPRDAVNEFVRRNGRIVPYLADIVGDLRNWTRDLPEWWAVVHAVYILGAISNRETILPLLKALRLSTVLECDWVFEDLPSIFGRIGKPCADGLSSIAQDRTSDWFTRAIAMECLAAVTITEPDAREDVFRMIGAIFLDGSEEPGVRESAGNVLLDFLCHEYRGELEAFAKVQEVRRTPDDAAATIFTADDVRREFDQQEKNLWHYTKDWLAFYDAEEIRNRQDRWAKE